MKPIGNFMKILSEKKKCHTHLMICFRIFYDRMVDNDDRRIFFSLVKQNCQTHFKVDLGKILFPHVLAGASVVMDEHVRTICFGDFMHPEAEKKVRFCF